MSTIKTDTLQNVAGTLSVPVGTVVNGSAKAWVNFNGTGTVAIRAGFNVSSITDNGVGDYTVNFTNAMADANYAAIWMGTTTGGGSVRTGTIMSITNSAFQYQSVSGTGTPTDFDYQLVSIFR